MKTLWLALPAYNEERSLPALLERCRPVADALAKQGRRFAVVVVDDGSKDQTIARAQSFAPSLAVEVVPHVVNRGLGAAITTCLVSALERASDDDAIATMDADNTHDPALLPAMWDLLERETADVVIASRYVQGGEEVGLSPLRRVLSRGASFLLTTVAPVKGARDYTCGFRVYRPSTLRRARAAWGDRFVEEAGFTCMAEILLKLGRGGARVMEWPLVLRYDLKEGASKMKILRTITRYFAMAWRIRTRPMPRVV
jgi:dolichol-phosphate mannosyltransferase